MRIPVVCLALATLVLQACGAQPGGWTTHKDSSGITIPLPPSWTASVDHTSGRVALQGPAHEQLVVWPVFIPGGLNNIGSAQSTLRQLASRAGFGAFQWSQPSPLGPTAIRVAGSAGDRAAVAALAWSATPDGAAGYLYVTSAPRGAYRAQEVVFARVLDGFRITGNPGAAASGGKSGGLSYVTWRDPTEGAFTIDVPSGWKVEGGVFRKASVDIRSTLRTASPGGDIWIMSGDAEIPPFTEPSQMLTMTGFREGSAYSPGYGVVFQVRRYLPGVEFARQYAMMKPPQGCQNLRITENRPLPDFDAAGNSMYQRMNMPGTMMRQQSGEVSFTCEQGGRTMAGYFFASTLLTRMSSMPGGNWNLQRLVGYLAAPDKAATAHSILEHMVASIKIDPVWQQRQSRTTMETSRIVSNTSAAISKMSSDSYWARQRSNDELSRRRSNATLGVEDVIDDTTGRQMKVESGSNYYWIDNRGTVVGTQTDSRPNLDFRELTRLP